MKKAAYYKNQIQIIKKTKARFLSIFVIVFLGSAFFAGLRHAPSIMDNSMGNYLDKQAFNDIQLVSTVGFSQTDIDVIKDIEGIETIESGLRFDALIQQGTKQIGVTVYTNDCFPTNVNTIEVVEGRLPKTNNECIIDFQIQEMYSIKIGDRIDLENNQGSKSFKVVGVGNDPRFISAVDRGTNTLGNGSNGGFVSILTKDNEFLALPQELYDLRKEDVLYNELRITIDKTKGTTVFSESYEKQVQDVLYQVKTKLQKQFTENYNEIYTEASDELSKHQEDYKTGYNEYLEGVLLFDKTMNEAKIELSNGKLAILEQRKLLLNAKEELGDSISNLPEELGVITVRLEEIKTKLESLQNQSPNIDDLEQQLPSREEVEDELQQQIPPTLHPDIITQLNQDIDDVQTKIKSLQEGVSGLLELYSGSIALDKIEHQLEKTQNEIEIKEIETNKQFEEIKTQIDEAKIKLDEGQKALEQIPKGNLIVLTKSENAGVLSFEANGQSMEALSLLFPLIFFLVAALVSLTTMTRMVEEQRQQSGTLRALGYSKKDILRQYCIYALLATFVASILGIVFGVLFFPWIIYFLYTKMLYQVNAPVQIHFDFIVCVITLFISVVLTVAVTIYVCNQELRLVPASLLRPKPPKNGKRIFLERIPFIWKKMSFNQKVTLRNVFRYKKRFFMSIIGISGCSALIVVGFGLRNSVSQVARMQFEEVWKYDGTISYEGVLFDDDLLKVENELEDQYEIDQVVSCYTQMIQIQGDQKDHQGFIVVGNDSIVFEDVVSLKDTTTNDQLHLDDKGVIIGKKLSELLDIQVGQQITIVLDNQECQVNVAGIQDGYFMHYIYCSKEYYEQVTNDKFKANNALFNLKDDQKKYADKVEAYCKENEGLSGVTFTSGSYDSFEDQIASVDSVVLIMIVCAGSLAFIVLYNLTNINIQERTSEIATIKVLGFYPREVYDYIFKENYILAFIGSIVGFGLGFFIHKFLIGTVELEMMMFVRELNPMSFFYAFFFTMIFTTFINQSMKRVIRKIDMVESLKSVE